MFSFLMSGSLLRHAPPVPSKGLTRVLRVLQTICLLIAISFSVPIMRSPEQPIFLTSLASDPRHVPNPIRLLAGMYHAYAISCVMAYLVVTTSTVLVFVHVMTHFVVGLR